MKSKYNELIRSICAPFVDWHCARGFTMIELLVTIAIFLIITGIVVASYPKFNNQVSVGKVARDMALTIRQAQAYGLAVKERGGSAPSSFGVHVGAATDKRKELIVFTDPSNPSNPDANGLYDEGSGCGSGDTECTERFFIRGNITMFDYCLLPSGGGPLECSGPDDSGGITSIDVAFKRATPDALIYKNHDNTTGYNAAFIKLRSDRYPDKIKVVRIWYTGQISIQDE